MFKTPSSKSLLCCRKRGSTDILWAASDQCHQCQWSRCSIYRGSVDHLCESLWGVYSRSMTSDIGMDGPQILGWLLKGCSARAWRCASPERAGSEFHGFDWFADLSAMSFDYILWSCCSSCATFEYMYILQQPQDPQDGLGCIDSRMTTCNSIAALQPFSTYGSGMHSQCQSTDSQEGHWMKGSSHYARRACGSCVS